MNTSEQAWQFSVHMLLEFPVDVSQLIINYKCLYSGYKINLKVGYEIISGPLYFLSQLLCSDFMRIRYILISN